MNTKILGIFITATGVVFLLISFLSVFSAMETQLDHEEWMSKRHRSGTYTQYSAAIKSLNQERLSCVVSNFGNSFCPMSGNSAIFTYVGLLISMIGVGVIVSSARSRKRDEV